MKLDRCKLKVCLQIIIQHLLEVAWKIRIGQQEYDYLGYFVILVNCLSHHYKLFPQATTLTVSS